MNTFKTALTTRRQDDIRTSIREERPASGKLHRFLIDHSPDIIFTLDELGRFSFINHRIRELLHHEPGNLLGHRFTQIVEENDTEKARYFVDDFLDNRRTTDEALPGIRLQLRDSRRGLKQRHFEVTLSRVDGSAGLPDASVHRFEIHGTAREVTAQLEAEAFIHFQAYHDILTHLPNRSLFRDRVDTAILQAQRHHQKPAVMFIDLDRFKAINDSLGHTVGDRLLQAASQRLQGCIRKADTLSRFGGDEFTVLLTDVANEKAALRVADKILDRIGAPFHVSGHEISIGASIGMALYPEGGRTLDQLVKNADTAMYRVKSNGKNGVTVFTRTMDGGSDHCSPLDRGARDPEGPARDVIATRHPARP